MYKKLRDLLARITAGSWSTSSEWTVRTDHDDEMVATCTAYTNHQDDAEFIVEAHNAMPALLDELDRLHKLEFLATAVVEEWLQKPHDGRLMISGRSAHEFWKVFQPLCEAISPGSTTVPVPTVKLSETQLVDMFSGTNSLEDGSEPKG